MFAVSSDYVVRAGEIGQCMYFIRAGTCMVLLPLTPEDGAASDDVVGGHGERFSHVKTIGSGDYFGEVCVQNVLVLQPISPLVRMAGPRPKRSASPMKAAASLLNVGSGSRARRAHG